ncbi:unnamed protein product [Brachionus calyciflorus]|uniref:Uncharacterized protein n=1 Tax=Brachionus calyciflorus TaxID=104777 RepID=A0A814H070_9BILA|nr:unnamed protein product [Brachionus calyciflorus]
MQPLMTQSKEKTTPIKRQYSINKTEQIFKQKDDTFNEKIQVKSSFRRLDGLPVNVLNELIDTLLETKFKIFEKRLSCLDLSSTNQSNTFYELSDSIKIIKNDLNDVEYSNTQNHKVTKELLNSIINKIIGT